MIERLTARNFKCFKKLDLKFSPTVTTIIGPNDSGKTSILQLLGFVCLNKPRKKYVRWGEKQMTANLFVDGRKITRRTGKINSYALNGKTFKAFRGDVPEEIANQLAVAEINFQKQLASSFWLSMTPGQLAKHLNSLVDLETIDQTQQAITKRIRHTNAAIDVCKSRLVEARREKNSLKGIKKLDKRRCSLERRAAVTIPRINAQTSELRTIINNASLLTGRIQIANQMTCVCDRIKCLGRDVQACQSTEDDLRRLIDDVRRHRTILDGPPAPVSTRIETLLEQIDEQNEEIESLKRLIRTADQQEHEACQLQTQIEKAERNLKAKLGGRCPLCLNSLSKDLPI